MDLSTIRSHLTTAPHGSFTSDISSSVLNQWINRKYAQVWNAAAWPWRHAPLQSLSVIAGTNSYAIPSDYAETTMLFDELGGRLQYLLPGDWQYRYNDPSVARGRPQHFTIMGGSLYLGPTPDQTATWKHSYLKRLQHFHAGGAATTGAMSDDTDVPIMGYSTSHDDFHELLVIGSAALGLKLTQADISLWKPLEDEFVSGVGDMIVAFGQADRGERPGFSSRVWGDTYARSELYWTATEWQ